MRRLLRERLLWALPTLLGLAVGVFVLVRVVPGDPVAMMTPPGATRADIDRLYARHGLDQPMTVQFFRWATQLAQGEFGESISLRTGVGTLIGSRLPATLELVIPALLLAMLMGFGIALLSAHAHVSVWRIVLDGFTGFIQAIPDFLWALLLMLLLAVALPLLPPTGRVDPSLVYVHASNFLLLESVVRGEWRLATSAASHLILPVLALALPLMASIVRVLSTSLRQALEDEYAYTARAKGYSRSRLLWHVALPNAMIPTLTLTGAQFALLLGGTVMVEQVFAYPGIGQLAVAAVQQRDLPLIQGLVLCFGVLFIAINLSVDLLCLALDPRTRTA